jgi:hypothetical protein
MQPTDNPRVNKGGTTGYFLKNSYNGPTYSKLSKNYQTFLSSKQSVSTDKNMG